MILILADGVVLDAKLWSEEFYCSIKLLSDTLCVCLEKLAFILKVQLFSP